MLVWMYRIMAFSKQTYPRRWARPEIPTYTPNLIGCLHVFVIVFAGFVFCFAFWGKVSLYNPYKPGVQGVTGVSHDALVLTGLSSHCESDPPHRLILLSNSAKPNGIFLQGGVCPLYGFHEEIIYKDGATVCFSFLVYFMAIIIVLAS